MLKRRAEKNVSVKVSYYVANHSYRMGKRRWGFSKANGSREI
jgi:hypothetical protein